MLDGELLRNLPLGVTGEETDFGVSGGARRALAAPRPGTEASLVEYHKKCA